MSKLLRWFMVGVAVLMLSACGGGGGSSNIDKDVVKLNPNTILIDKNLSKDISKITFENNITKLSVSDKFANAIKKGDILSIPMGTDKRFPIGKSGRVESIYKDGNSTNVSLSNVKLMDIVNKLKTKEQEIPLTTDNLIDVIIPPYVTASMDNNKSKKLLGKNSKVFLNGGIVASDKSFKRYSDNGDKYLTKALLKLNLALKLDGDEKNTDGTVSKRGIVFNIDGIITDLKLNLKPDINILFPMFSFKTIATGKMDIDISTVFSGELNLAHFDDKWKTFEESESKTLGIQLKGLNSDDKIGKIPLIGLMYSAENIAKVLVGGVTPTKLKSVDGVDKLDDKLAIIVWVYFDAKVGIVVEGKLGLKSKVKFNFGVDKNDGEKHKDINTFEPIDNNTPVVETYINGKVGIEGKLGFSTAVDLLISGIRFANIGMFVGGKYKQEFELKSDDESNASASYYLQNFDDGTKWKWKIPNMVFCTQGSIGAGLIANVDFDIGAKAKLFTGELESDLHFHDQYPRKEDMDNLEEGERTGIWWKLKEYGHCYNVPTPAEFSANYIYNDRKAIGEDKFKIISDKYYKYAYLSNRIYTDKSTSTLLNTIVENSTFLTMADYELKYIQDHIEKDKARDSWQTINVVYNELNGFKAGLYKNVYTNEYIVSYGGTTANSYESQIAKIDDSVKDILTDVSLLSIVSFGQPYEALSFFDKSKKFVEDRGGKITGITGHSLGGALAQYAGLYSGVKTVTFNSAPLPYNNIGSALSFAGKVHKEKDGTMESMKFVNKDKIINIMTPYDPISTISTAIMSLDESNSAYLFAVKSVLSVPQNQKMDYLLTGEKIYIPVEDQGGFAKFSNHSMDLIENKFKTNTNYNVKFDLDVADETDKDNVVFDVENLVVTDGNNIELGISDIPYLSWELNGREGNIIKETNNSIITVPKDNNIYEIVVYLHLVDGRILSKLIYTHPAPSNFKAVATENTITLHWDEIKGSSAYKICFSKDAIDDANMCEENGGTLISSISTTKVIDNLEKATPYNFKVRVITDGYKALWSKSITKSLKAEVTISLHGDQSKEESKSTVFPIFRSGDDTLINSMECNTDKSLEITNTKTMARVEIPAMSEISEFNLSCVAYDIDGLKVASDVVTVTVTEKETLVAGSTKLKKTGQTKSYDADGNETTDGSVKDDGYYQSGVAPSYTRDANDTVTDNVTGLIWQDNADVTNNDRNWTDAKTYCEDLDFAGSTEWRLPTIDELVYITDRGKSIPAINSAFHNVDTSSNYWSSTTNASNTGNAWVVLFNYGDDFNGDKSYSYFVRCVRAEQAN